MNKIKINDKVKVKDCGIHSYHAGEENIEGIVVRNNNTEEFPVKLDNGNCYLEKCLKIII